MNVYVVISSTSRCGIVNDECMAFLHPENAVGHAKALMEKHNIPVDSELQPDTYEDYEVGYSNIDYGVRILEKEVIR